MSRLLRVLIVEDSEDDTLLLVAHLDEGGYDVQWERVETAEAMSAALDRASWDMVLADYRLPRFSGPAALALMQEKGIDLPFILVSGTVGEDTAVEAMRAGAHDYIVKGNLTRLIPAIERELREAETRRLARRSQALASQFAAIVQSTDEAILAMTLEGIITAWNPGAERLYGYTAEEMVGKSANILLAPECDHCAESFEEILREVGRGRRVPPRDFVRLRKDGSRIHVSSVAAPIRDVAGSITGISWIAHDVTDRVRAEEALRASEQQLSALYRQIPVVVILSHLEKGYYLQVNDAFERILGYTRQEAIGRTSVELGVFASEEDRQRYARAVRETGGVREVEATWYTKSGDTICVLLSGSAIEIGGERYIITVATDITARKEAERALRRYELITANTRDIILFMRSDDGRILEANAAAVEAYGYSREELLTLSITDLRAPGTQALTPEQMQRAEGGGILFETVHQRRDGRTFPVEVSSRGATIGETRTLISVIRDISERKRAEEERQRLVQQMERERAWLETIMTQMPSGVVVTEAPSGRPTYQNEQATAILGHGLLPIKDWREYDAWGALHDPETPYRPEEYPLARALRGETIIGEETLYRRGDGTLTYLSVSAGPAREPSGKIVGAITTFQDIAARKRVEAALHESEERLQQLANAMPQLVWTADPDGTVDYFNDRIREFTGFAQDATGAWQWTPVLHPDDLQPTVAAWEHAIRTGTTYQLAHRLRRADGTYRWYLSRAIPARDAEGRVVKWYGTATDIDEQKRTEERSRFLAEASNVLVSSLDYHETLDYVARLVLPTLADHCMVDLVEEDGSIQRVVVAHADPEKQALMDELRYHPPDSRMCQGVPLVLRTGKPLFIPDATPGLYEELAQDSEHLRILQALAPQSIITAPLVARGRTLGAVTIASEQPGRRYGEADLLLVEELGRRAGLAIDNARLYAAERAARAEATEANQAKDQFVALISHELRNPLSAIQAGVDLLRSASVQDKRMARALEIVDRNTKLQARLVNDLLDLSRLSRGKLQLQRSLVDVSKFLVAAEQATAKDVAEAGLTLTCHVDPDLWVYGDFDRLQQVVMNLLSNSTKFTPAGGTIHLAAEKCGADRVCISVQDTGVGIEQEQLGKLFTMFEQGEVAAQRKPGLGLGLALVKGITERHGGRVWAESDGAGKGSRFIVELPLADRTTGPAARAGNQRSRGPRVEVLLVEDNPDTRGMLTETLALAGYRVRAAGSGEEALDLLRYFRPDVMLVDIGLPGINGFEFLRQARALPGMANVVALAVTGYGQEEDVRRGREAGFAGHFIKPVDIQALDDLIQEQLRRTTS